MKCIRVLNGMAEVDGQFNISGTIYPNGITANNTNDFNVIMQVLRFMPKPEAPRSCFGSGLWVNSRVWLNDDVWNNG